MLLSLVETAKLALSSPPIPAKNWLTEVNDFDHGGFS